MAKYYHDGYKKSRDYDSCYDDSWNNRKKDERFIVNVNCCDGKKNEERKSAFRATKAGVQAVAANTSVKVLFQNEQFDLGNEYNTATSTFIPATSGIYSLSAAISFVPIPPNIPFKTTINFFINGLPTDDGDSEFQGVIPGVTLGANIVATSDTRQLNAGDVVEVFMNSNVPGTILSPGVTRFSGFRVA